VSRDEVRRNPERPSGEDPIGALLKVAGRRPTAPGPVVDRVFASTHQEWRRMVRRRRRRGWGLGILGSLTAGLAVFLGVGFLDELRSPEGPSSRTAAAEVATVEVVVGDTARLRGPDAGDAAKPIEEADTVFEGAAIATGSTGGVALRLADGGSLRLGSSTDVRFLGRDDVELVRGALYLDGGLGGASRLAVHTEIGVIRERGTQFEVRILDREVRVRVREGAVVVERDEPVVASAGLELRISHGGDVSRWPVSASDESWGWVLDLAPSFHLGGRSLGDFLGWFARETGKEVTFSAAEDAGRLSAIVLYGSVEGLRPDEALDAVLPTCGLSALESEDAIAIR
jgi:ferric-dicitrate binding protein FerR (iron transport regulator)